MKINRSASRKGSSLWGMALAALLFVSGGCTRENNANEAEPAAPTTLELSKEELTMGKGAGMETVTIQTDAPSWSFIVTPGDASWVTAAQSGSELNITVQPNELPESRKAAITVIAGGLTKQISLEQSSSDLVFNVETGETSEDNSLMFSALGEEKVISVRTNGAGWKVEAADPAAPWLTVHADTNAGVIVLRADRNPETKGRTTTLKLTPASGEQVAITLTQAGQVRYYLPYQEERKVLNYKDLILFEKSRGNALTFFQVGDDSGWWAVPDMLTFASSSDVLPRVTYVRDLGFSLVYNYAEFPIADKAEILEGGGFREFLKAEGYIERSGSTEEMPQLESADGFLFVDLKADDETGEVTVRFTPQILQDGPMPSFESFPYGVMDSYSHIYNTEWKYPQVDEWELNTLHSSVTFEITNTYYAAASDEMLLKLYQLPEPKANPEDEDFHWYQFYFQQSSTRTDAPSPEFIQAVHYYKLVFKDYEKVIFLIGDNQYKVTKEFRDLAEDNGFVYRGILQSGIVFDKTEDNIRLTVQMDNQDEALFGAPVVAVLQYEHHVTNPDVSSVADTSRSKSSDTGYAAATATSFTKSLK